MLRVILGSLFARKFRLLLSVLSIVLGIAFVAGSLMFTDMLSRSLQEILKSTVADVNVAAKSAAGGIAGRAATGAIPAGLDAEHLERVRAIPGVVRAEPTITNLQTYVLDQDDKLIVVGNSPGIALNWHDAPAAGGVTAARILEGEAPDTAGEVAVDPKTLAKTGKKIGDRVKISTPFNGIEEFTVVATASQGTGGTAGASYVFMTLSETQRLFAEKKDNYQGIWVVTDTTDLSELVAEIDKIIPEGWQARTGEELAQEIEELLDTRLGFVNTFLLVFAGIALLVASLLILNTFAILVAQRARELAVLRAIGATRRQIRASVLLEAIVLGLIGSTLGIAVGYGLVWAIELLLESLGIGLSGITPNLTPPALIASYLLGFGITVVASLLPAFRAARTRPVQALTEVSTPKEEPITSSVTMTGIAAIELAIAALVCGLWLGADYRLWWVGIGSALLLIGCVLSATLIGWPIMASIGGLFRLSFGEVGRLAQLNSRRQPRRTAATSATLMIGLSLVTTVAVLSASVSASLRTQLSADQRGDFLVTPANFSPFDAALVAKVEAGNAIAWAGAFYPARIIVDQDTEPITVIGSTTRTMLEASPTKYSAGNFAQDPDTAVVSIEFAQQRNLSIGSTFEISGELGKKLVLVTGITAEKAPGEVVVQHETLAQVTQLPVVNRIVVFAQEGADLAEVRGVLTEAVKDYPQVVVGDVREFVQRSVEQFEQLVGVLYALLGLALVISVLGVINTLSLSIIERTREVGLLRAVGLTRRQLRRMVSLESVLITINGSILGIGLGLLFGMALQRINRDDGISVLDIPWWQLALFAALSALFGWLAAISPARSAARQPVLEAIANE